MVRLLSLATWLMVNQAANANFQSSSSLRGSQHDSQTYRRLDPVCTYDHNAIQSTQEISVQTQYKGQDAYWGIDFLEGPLANLQTQGWCVDIDRPLWSDTFKMDMFSSYDNDFHVDAVDKPQNLPMLTYLINNFETGEEVNLPPTADVPEGCVGTITYKEFQGAVWKIIDDKKSHRSIRGKETCIVDYLEQQAREHGENYEPDCQDPNAKVALMLIVDDEYETIENQVIIAEVNIADTGVCKCDAPPPSTTLESAGVFGDPHFKTWSGEKYDFHGVCDLVLLHSPHFANGLGLDIHIRTKRTKQWSYIASATLRIGQETLEIQGGNTNQQYYWLNQVPNANLQDGLSGFPIIVNQVNSKQHEYIVDLGQTSGSISFKTYKDMVRVDVNALAEEDFVGSVGMMGSYNDQGSKVARDEITLIEDPVAFGFEWQVLSTEPMLFHQAQGPQAPEKCELPTIVTQRRRLGEVDDDTPRVSLQEAEVACGRVSASERDQCIFDVLATNDKDLAGAY